MALNTNTNLYGRENVKSSSYEAKSKGSKIFGFRYPFGAMEDGLFLNKSSDIELIKSNLRQLLLTRRGERVMLPEFGTNLKYYLMEPLDQSLLSRIRKEILESMYKYASNVTLNKLLIVPLESGTFSGGNSLKIQMYCSLKEAENLSFEVKVEL